MRCSHRGFAAQMADQWFSNPKDMGSSPTEATFFSEAWILAIYHLLLREDDSDLVNANLQPFPLIDTLAPLVDGFFVF